MSQLTLTRPVLSDGDVASDRTPNGVLVRLWDEATAKVTEQQRTADRARRADETEHPAKVRYSYD